MPAPLTRNKPDDVPLEVIPVLSYWVRGALVVIALGLMAVFVTAAWLNPYDDQGRPLRMATHKQLGLPPCTFYLVTGGVPCPSCGMTTSFALLIHGDVVNSLRANAAGTLLALFWLALLVWSLVCAVRGQLWYVRSIEVALTRAVVFFLVLMFARWVVVLILIWDGAKV